MKWLIRGSIVTVILIVIVVIALWAYILATALTKGAEHISKHGLKSVVESVWEGAQDNSGSAPDSAQQNKSLNPEKQD